MGPSIWQLLIILVIVLLLFGTKRIGNLGSDLGAAIKGFRNAFSEGEKENPKNPARLDQDRGNTIDVEVVACNDKEET